MTPARAFYRRWHVRQRPTQSIRLELVSAPDVGLAAVGFYLLCIFPAGSGLACAANLAAGCFRLLRHSQPEPRREEMINEDAVELARAILEKMPDQTRREETSDHAKLARTILEKKPGRIKPPPTVAARWPENGRRPP